MLRLILVCLLFVFAGQAISADNKPAIAIIVDDLGNTSFDARVIELPGAVACAFLPHAPHTRTLARLAHSHNKEVLLHAPMESAVPDTDHLLGPGSLTLHMTEQEFIASLQASLSAVPHVNGVNNHMGSLLTQHPGHMLWLMREINRHGDLFFIDSRTTSQSVARDVANENHVPTMSRDIFLDAEQNSEFIDSQFDQLLSIARKRGTALGIAHPYPETMQVLQRRLLELEAEGVDLIPVGELIKRQQKGSTQWQLSLSRLPRAAKNSKP